MVGQKHAAQSRANRENFTRPARRGGLWAQKQPLLRAA